MTDLRTRAYALACKYLDWLERDYRLLFNWIEQNGHLAEWQARTFKKAEEIAVAFDPAGDWEFDVLVWTRLKQSGGPVKKSWWHQFKRERDGGGGAATWSIDGGAGEAGDLGDLLESEADSLGVRQPRKRAEHRLASPIDWAIKPEQVPAKHLRPLLYRAVWRELVLLAAARQRAAEGTDGDGNERMQEAGSASEPTIHSCPTDATYFRDSALARRRWWQLLAARSRTSGGAS